VPVNKGLSMGCLLLEIQVGLVYKNKFRLYPTDNIMHLYYIAQPVSVKTAAKILLLLPLLLLRTMEST
jgi:hypothetical protein